MQGPLKIRIFLFAIFNSAFLVTFASADTSLEPQLITQTRPVIRSITIDIRKVFDEPNLEWFYRAVNRLKIETKEKVIKRELLFKEGDALNPFAVAESERILRELPFLRKVSILTSVEGADADVLVIVQDTWTLFPQFSFTSGGGNNKSSVGLIETNLLGYGKSLAAVAADDEGRDSIQAVYEDPRFFETDRRFLIGQFVRSDGTRSLASYGLPLRSLLQNYGWSANFEYSNLVGRLFENGDERFIFRSEKVDFSAGATFARGDPEELTHRYSLGYGFLSERFSQADQDDFEDANVDPDTVVDDPGLLATDRRFSGPFFSYQQIEPDYITLNYVDRFERLEDFNLGTEWRAEVGLAPEVVGSRINTLLLELSRIGGIPFGEREFVRGGVIFGARFTEDGFNDTVARLEGRYFNVLGIRKLFGQSLGAHTLAASAIFDFSHELDKDKEILLGASNGLRGYQDRTFSGEHRFLLNLEDRVHFAEDVLKLVSIGGAAFFDLGGTSANGPKDLFAKKLYSNVGVGLRLSFPRSSGGRVFRFDLAFPLRDGPDGSQQWEPRLLVTVGQLFTAGLTSDAPSIKQANVDIGF